MELCLLKTNFAGMFRGRGMRECTVNGLTTANNG